MNALPSSLISDEGVSVSQGAVSSRDGGVVVETLEPMHASSGAADKDVRVKRGTVAYH